MFYELIVTTKNSLQNPKNTVNFAYLKHTRE